MPTSEDLTGINVVLERISTVLLISYSKHKPPTLHRKAPYGKWQNPTLYNVNIRDVYSDNSQSTTVKTISKKQQ